MCFVLGCNSSQSSYHLFKMPVMWWETYSDKCFLLCDVYSTEHDSLDEWVHSEPLHLSVPKYGVLHFVSHDKCGRIEEQSETVRSVVVARHAVCLEVLQIFYPQLHYCIVSIVHIPKQKKRTIADSLLEVIRLGFEPKTPTLKVLCSTNWASGSTRCFMFQKRVQR